MWLMNVDHVCDCSKPASRNSMSERFGRHQLHMIGKQTSVHKALEGAELALSKGPRFEGGTQNIG